MTGQQITQPFNRPFFTGGVKPDLDTGFYPVSIDGIEFMVDLSSGLYRRFNVDVLRTRQNRQADESLLLSPEVWRSTVESWHQGAGQTRFDRESSLPFRFQSSRNINCWDQWGIDLLDSTVKEFTTTGETFMEVAYTEAQGQALFFYDNAGAKWFTDLSSPPVDLALGSAVRATASDGSTVYAALNDLSVVAITDGVVSPFTTLPQVPTLLALVKGFLVAGIGNALYDITSGVADDTTRIGGTRLPGHRWVAATDGLGAAYLLGGQGDRWSVYWITVREDASTLDPPVVAAPLPEGETGTALGSYLGFVLIGTDRGVRFATTAGDNTLTYGRLIVTGNAVESFEGQDRFVWFGIGGQVPSNEEPLRQTWAGLARMDLSTFTAPLTPAFASDLVASDEPTAAATHVVTFQGDLVFVVPNRGVYRQDRTTKATDGWLMQGVFNQGVRDTKIGLYSHVSCEPLVGSIGVDMAENALEPLLAVIDVDAPGSVSSGNVNTPLRWDGLVVRYRLVSAGAASPRMTRFEVRCVPKIGQAHEWQVPLILSSVYDYRNVTGGRDLSETMDNLMRLVEQGATFTYREGDRSYSCFSPGYEWRPMSQVSGTDQFQGIFVLRIRAIS